MIRVLAGAIGLGLLAASALAADPVEIGIGYLHRTGVKPALSLVEQPAANDGVAGARLAIEDNNTTGRFLNQHFTLEEFRLKDGGDAAKAAVALADRNIGFIIADLPADALLRAADALRDRGTVLFNAGAIDDRLREQDCRANLIHVAPTRSMLADALAQYLVWKRRAPPASSKVFSCTILAPPRVSAPRSCRKKPSRMPAAPGVSIQDIAPAHPQASSASAPHG